MEEEVGQRTDRFKGGDGDSWGAKCGHLRLRAGHPQTKGLWGLVAKVRPGCYSTNQSTGRAPGEVGAVGQAQCREQTAWLGDLAWKPG